MRISDWSSDVCSSDLVAAYSATAAWVAGVFQIVPSLGWIGAILGLYSLYLLYLGLPILMKAPAANAPIPSSTASITSALAPRSEERRVGTECVSKCRSRGWA